MNEKEIIRKFVEGGIDHADVIQEYDSHVDLLLSRSESHVSQLCVQVNYVNEKGKYRSLDNYMIEEGVRDLNIEKFELCELPDRSEVVVLWLTDEDVDGIEVEFSLKEPV